jgi:uncharacterized membrane protein
VPHNRSLYPWHRGHTKLAHPALQKVADDRTRGERVADEIAAFGGSWPFIFLFLALIAGWMIVNTVLIQRVIGHKAFDPYPYIALNLCLSGLAGLQAPIIMMSQNRASVRDEALAAHHYDETQKIDELIRQNTDLTEKVHQLAQQIHQLTTEVRSKVSG